MIREDASRPRFERRTLIALAVSSLAVNVSLLAWFGIRHGGDSARYLDSAEDLLASRAFRGQGGWVYVGYNGLVALCDAAGVGERGIVAIQLAVAACATVA